MKGRALVIVFASGLLFALGLGLAGMTSPSKVLAFLDVSGGHWDPSLALVMGAAVAVHLPVYRWLRRRPGFAPPPSTCGPDGEAATATAPLDENADLTGSSGARSGAAAGWRAALTDGRLLAGAALFGLGWGLGGYCPGPAVVSIVSAAPGALVFVGAMLAGMLAFSRLPRARHR